MKALEKIINGLDAPDPGSIPIEELRIDTPIALCFGSEVPGLTKTVLDAADSGAQIPMQGFTQSLN